MRMVRDLPTGSFGNGYGVPMFHEGCKRKHSLAVRVRCGQLAGTGEKSRFGESGILR